MDSLISYYLKEFDMLITNKLTDEQRKMVQDIKEVVEV